MSIRRTILVLILLVGCLAFIGTDRGWVGWGFWLVALFLMGWEALEQGLGFLVLLIGIGVGCAIFWLPYGYFGQVTIEDWLIDHWYVPTFWLVTGIVGIWQFYRSSDETWESLKTEFDEHCALKHAPGKYPVQSGLLYFLEDSLFVSVAATEFGLIFVKSEKEVIRIPWKRVKVITQLGSEDQQSTTYSLQTKSLPMRVQAPWSDDFAEWIPSTVKRVDT